MTQKHVFRHMFLPNLTSKPMVRPLLARDTDVLAV
jgi:hypothetical protein